MTNLLVGDDHPLVDALASDRHPLTPQQLNACVITVGRLFEALDELAEKFHRPKTLARPDVSRFCDELKAALTRNINSER